MDSEETWKLRPHHALCASFFQGKGYSKAFVENMAAVLAALEAGREVVLKAEPDVICAACPHLRGAAFFCGEPCPRGEDEETAGRPVELCGELRPRCEDEEKVRRFDREVLRLLQEESGTVVSWRELSHRIRAEIIEAGKRREVCGDCTWDAICR